MVRFPASLPDQVARHVRLFLLRWQYRSARRWRRLSLNTHPISTRAVRPGMRRLQLIQIARWFALLSFCGVILGLTGFFIAFAWVSRSLPKPGEVVTRQHFSTRIFDRNGKLLYDLFDDERRIPVKYDQIPVALRHATVAVEDKDFYQHQGFDPLTPFRMVYNFIFRRGRVVGGSTLTQQLVKNSLLTNERSLQRKFKEFVLAVQMERTFTKDQILELYLNEASYGGNSSGVGAASEQYFGKPVSQLSLVESAILAGLPQRPSAYSPHSGKTDSSGVPLWKPRTLGVLRRMREDNYITAAEYDGAVAQLDTVVFAAPQSSIKAPHFVFYVRDLLEKQFGENVMAKGGLQVTTSLDLDLHQKAQQIVKDEIEKVKDLNITNGAAMVMNPQTGEILSMVGSADYNSTEIDGKFNVAVDGLRQPGSSIKPLTYLGFFRLGNSPATMIADVPTTFQRNEREPKYEPRNYDGKFRGPVSARNSLGSSLNIPAVKALASVGIKNFLAMAEAMGFPTLAPTNENLKRFGLAATLGGAEVHLIDTTTAYSAFANGGYKVEPVALLKVTDSSNRTLYEYRHVQGPQVMSAEEAFLINNVLSDNSARLLAFGANSLLNTGKPIAVKTGTTNDQKDNWTIGWSQNIMVGTWVGNNNSTAMKRVASGITGASPIWRQIINEAVKMGYATPDWTVPPNIEKVELDQISGYPKHDEFPSRTDYVIKGTQPVLPDPIHAKIKLCKGENKLATDAKIVSGDYDEKEFITLKENDPFSEDGLNRWQDAINAWIAGQPDEKYKAPTEYCGSTSDVSARVSRPDTERTYTETDIDIDVSADSGDGIEKLEIWIDGSLRETVTGRTYTARLNLPTGRHEIYAKARSRGGKEAQSNVVKIGTGGADWRPPEPSPTPSPNPSPTPTPSGGQGGGNGHGQQ